MSFTYILYLISFLFYPVFLLILSFYFDIKKIKGCLKWIVLFFAIHNLLYYLGFSIKGDYADYVIFSLEYAFLVVLIIMFAKTKKIWLKVFQIIGLAVVISGFIQAIPGIFLFIVISQDFEKDKVYNFENDEKMYQTRRYSFGFATLDDITYDYYTYRQFKYMPFEKLLNKSHFSRIKDSMNFEDERFSIDIETKSNKRAIIFKSPNEEPYEVIIE